MIKGVVVPSSPTQVIQPKAPVAQPTASAPKAAAPTSSGGGGGGRRDNRKELEPQTKDGFLKIVPDPDKNSPTKYMLAPTGKKDSSPTSPAPPTTGGVDPNPPMANGGGGGIAPPTTGGGEPSSPLAGLMSSMGDSGGEAAGFTPYMGVGLRAGLGQRAIPMRNPALAGLGKIY